MPHDRYPIDPPRRRSYNTAPDNARAVRCMRACRARVPLAGYRSARPPLARLLRRVDRMDRAADAGPDRLPAGYELVETFTDGVLYGVRREGAEGPLALTILPADIATDIGRLEASR